MTKLKSTTQILLAVLASFIIILTSAVCLSMSFKNKNASADSNNLVLDFFLSQGGTEINKLRGNDSESFYLFLDITKSDGTTTHLLKNMAADNNTVIGIDNITKLHLRAVNPPTVSVMFNIFDYRYVYFVNEITLTNISKFMQGNTLKLTIEYYSQENTWFNGGKIF